MIPTFPRPNTPFGIDEEDDWEEEDFDEEESGEDDDEGEEF